MEIRLKGTVTLSDIAHWEAAPKDLAIHIYRDSQFEIGAEGVALGFLQNWLSKGIKPIVISTFHPESENEFGAFGTLFGIYLSYTASKIVTLPQETDSRELITNALWKYISSKGGSIGNAKWQYIVFRDPDYLIPQCMQEQGNEDFPFADRFKAVLTEQTHALGVDPVFGSLTFQRSVVTYVYQACRNSFEHGRPLSPTQRTVGIRGISIQKHIFAKEEEVRRRACSLSSLREYLIQNWSDPSNKKKAFLSITVADIGEGIQNTLPGLEGEDKNNRLDRAIFTNATRKPLSEEIERGKGLPYILDAARDLKAFLLVTSAELCGYVDFSDYIKYPNTAQHLTRITEFPFEKNCGTSITFVWPVGQIGGEQLSLLNA